MNASIVNTHVANGEAGASSVELLFRLPGRLISGNSGIHRVRSRPVRGEAVFAHSLIAVSRNGKPCTLYLPLCPQGKEVM